MRELLLAWRERRARRALAKAVRIVGDKTIAKWVLEGVLERVEDCPFGCIGELSAAQEEARLERSARDHAEGKLAALAEAADQQAVIVDRLLNALLRERTRTNAEGGEFRSDATHDDRGGAGPHQPADRERAAHGDPQVG